MKTRPSLVPGAICKWSRKARYNFEHFPHVTLIVLTPWDSATGNGRDCVRVMENIGAGFGNRVRRVRRREIWFTGKVGNVPVTKKGQVALHKWIGSMVPIVSSSVLDDNAKEFIKTWNEMNHKSKPQEQVWVCSCQADTPVGFPCWKCGAEERK